ncbi:MAG: YkgJ family cysteine cluster protein [Polyangiaceae bacterium]|jgi:Fe-S-cluster containining protein|nr:YkgJ family cysteine cluster protein [Polyangiaceae bacterium]
MVDAPNKLACRRCAACCHQREGTILVTADDVARWELLGRADMLASLTEGHFGMKAFAIGPNGACVHLGLPGAPNDCSKYDVRATVCRTFQAGCAQCHEFRTDRGMK